MPRWTELELPPVCNVLILYEDRECGTQAMELCRQLRRRIGNQVVLRLQLWRFDVLEQAWNRAAAAVHATKSNVFIFAARAGQTLRPALRHWMEQELRSGGHGQQRAFVVLLDKARAATPPANPDGLHGFLQKIARRLGIPLFSEFSSRAWRDCPPQPPEVPSRLPRGQRPSPAPQRRWQPAGS